MYTLIIDQDKSYILSMLEYLLRIFVFNIGNMNQLFTIKINLREDINLKV